MNSSPKQYTNKQRAQNLGFALSRPPQEDVSMIASVSAGRTRRETQAFARQDTRCEQLSVMSILAEGAIALSVTHSGGALFAS